MAAQRPSLQFVRRINDGMPTSGGRDHDVTLKADMLSFVCESEYIPHQIEEAMAPVGGPFGIGPELRRSMDWRFLVGGSFVRKVRKSGFVFAPPQALLKSS